MSKVEIKKIKCLEETDEVGSDDIYLVVFIAKLPSESTLITRGPNPWWDDFDEGEVSNDLVPIDDDFKDGTFYVITMMEGDSSADFAEPQHPVPVDKLRKKILNKYHDVFGSGAQNVFNALVPVIKQNINAFGDDDEIVNIGLYNPSVHFGDTRVIDFKGDGGHYRLWVRIAGIKVATICKSGDWGIRIVRPRDLPSFKAEIQKLFDEQHLRLTDVTTFQRNGQQLWAGVCRSGNWGVRFIVRSDIISFLDRVLELSDEGFRPVKMLSFVEDGQRKWAGICRSGDWTSKIITPRSAESFSVQSQKLFDNKGLRLIDMTTYVEDGQRMWAGISRSGDWASHVTLGEDVHSFRNTVDEFSDKDIFPETMLTYADNGQRRWAGILRSGNGSSQLLMTDSTDGFFTKSQNLFDNQGLRVTDMEFYSAFD